jgi:hypothetical protein
MDKKEARLILAEHLARYRSRPYAKLAALAWEVRTNTPEAVVPSGVRYQIEVQFFSNDKPDGDVPVSASVDDRGIPAFFPVTDDFILSPEERFLRECKF